MSKARLVITAVIVEGRTQAEVAAEYDVSKGWVSKLMARYKAAGEAAFEPRSLRPKNLTRGRRCRGRRGDPRPPREAEFRRP